MGTAEHPVPGRVKPSFVIFDIWALMLSRKCQSALMPWCQVSSYGLIQSGTQRYIASIL